MGRDPENRVVIKTLQAQVDHFLLSCKRPGSWGIIVQEQDPFRDLPSKCPSIAPEEMSNTPR